MRELLKKKDIEISLHRYGIDALGAMAHGLFASLHGYKIVAKTHRLDCGMKATFFI